MAESLATQWRAPDQFAGLGQRAWITPWTLTQVPMGMLLATLWVAGAGMSALSAFVFTMALGVLFELCTNSCPSICSLEPVQNSVLDLSMLMLGALPVVYAGVRNDDKLDGSPPAWVWFLVGGLVLWLVILVPIFCYWWPTRELALDLGRRQRRAEEAQEAAMQQRTAGAFEDETIKPLLESVSSLGIPSLPNLSGLSWSAPTFRLPGLRIGYWETPPSPAPSPKRSAKIEPVPAPQAGTGGAVGGVTPAERAPARPEPPPPPRCPCPTMRRNQGASGAGAAPAAHRRGAGSADSAASDSGVR